MTASDHLPVVADYQLPAVLEVIAGDVPPTLALGQPFSLEVTIRNDAPVDVPLGADELNYVLTTSGSLLFEPASGMALALDEGNSHLVEFDTATAGMKSGTIAVSSNGQGIAGGVVEIPVAYEVLSGLPGDYSATEWSIKPTWTSC